MSQRSVQWIGSFGLAWLLAGCAITGDFGNYQVGSPTAFVFEQNEERESYRFLDLPIFTFFEFTRDKGEGSIQAGFVESPLFKMFARRDDGRRSEFRIMDFRIFALFRRTRDGDAEKTHWLKLPLLGSVYGYEVAGDRQRRNVLFLSKEGPLPEPEPEPEPEEEPAAEDEATDEEAAEENPT